MAGASMNGIKSRIKSVQSTMQITKAMELVATSKLRRAKERAERSRPYYEAVMSAIRMLDGMCEGSSVFTKPSENGKTLFVVIAGDRGLAGGYNANVLKLAASLSDDCEPTYLPIGKKAVEYYRTRGKDIFAECEYVQGAGVGRCRDIALTITEAYLNKEISRVVLVYTRFVSMLTQQPVYEQLLPIEDCGTDKCVEPLYDTDPEELIAKIIPEYIAGILYSSVSEATASECGARRSAMNSANKNASEMIDTLMLKYNRARQAVITQEITEIVSGAEAL